MNAALFAHSPAFVATKTFQHTWEHGNAILRMALYARRGYTNEGPPIGSPSLGGAETGD